jgi:hypothetical protein
MIAEDKRKAEARAAKKAAREAKIQSRRKP